MIDETKSRIPIWLLWVRTTNNIVTLGAVTLTNRHAQEYRKIILRDTKVVNARIEKSEANHLFNPDWDSEWQKAYGEDHIALLLEQSDSIDRQARRGLEHELRQMKSALEAAKKKIAELERE